MAIVRSILVLTILLTSARHTFSQTGETPDYVRHVAPLLSRYCAGCHNEIEHDGKLALDSFEGLRKGGKRGEEVVPGKSVESRLYRVLQSDGKPRMPPRGEPAPTAEEIGVIKAWIDAGALGPTDSTSGASLLVTPKIELTAPPRLAVNALAFSGDGKRVAVARDKSVEVLLADSLSRVSITDGFAGAVNALEFSRDGSLLATASGEPGLFGELRIFRAVQGAVDTTSVRALRGHRDCLYAVAVSPDSSLIATAGYDSEIKLWSVERGEVVRTLKGHQGAVFDLAFRPDGKLLASSSADRTVKLWKIESGERLDTFSQPLKDQLTVAFGPSGEFLAAGGADNRIRLWRISEQGLEGTNAMVQSRFAHEGSILKLKFSPDGRFLASSADDRTVKIWEAFTLVEHRLLEPQPDWPAALGFSRDGRVLVVGRLDGSLGQYSSEQGQPIRISRAESSIFRAVGSVLFLAAFADTPKPELQAVEPGGLQRGATARFRLSGKALGPGAQLKVHSGKLTGRIVHDPAPGAEELWVEISAAADAGLGAAEISVATAIGESGRLRVFVDDLPQARESEPNDTLAESLAAPPFVLPACWWGTFGARGDSDWFSFELEAGETIVLDAAAASLGSKANLLMTLFDFVGRVVAASNDFDGSLDPLVAFQAEASGRFVLRLSELELNASREHFYRVTAGTFPFVASCFPLGVPPRRESEVELVGWNLPKAARARVKAGESGEAEVELGSTGIRSRRALRVVVGKEWESMESEPNDTRGQANALSMPGVVNGRIWQTAEGKAPDVDLFRLEAKAGETIVLETEASRRGSPCDTTIEVLDLEAVPVPRVLLQAVRNSYLTFQGIDSKSAKDIRLKNWEEMEVNQYVYLQGEVIKLFRAPQGPDSGFVAYSSNGQRKTYFGTTATTHSLDETCYVVEAHTPGTKPVPNGLPVFKIPFSNDDDSDRKIGTDSRLLFAPAASGAYLVRVSDLSGHDGPRCSYRLLARTAQPGFEVTLEGVHPSVGAGSGRGFTVTADRIDGFDGPITVRIEGMPPGFTVSNPISIEAGHTEARGTVFAQLDATSPPEGHEKAIRVTAEAIVGGRTVLKEVNSLGRIQIGVKPKLLVHLEAMGGDKDITIAPGQRVPAMLRVERNGHDDLVTFQVDNLPHGTIVDDIGLSGVVIRKGENERKIFLTAARWVGETDRYCHAVENEAGNQTSPPVLVHVRAR